MKGLFSLFMLFATIIAVTYAFSPRVSLPRPGQPEFPTFPGQGPFNPKPESYPRRRRSPDDDKNKVSVNANKDGGKTSYNIDYERKIYENKYGSIGANVGVNKNPYSKPETQVGISGSFHW